MKATINKIGTLVVIAESPLESYALKKWNEGYCYPEIVKGCASALAMKYFEANDEEKDEN